MLCRVISQIPLQRHNRLVVDMLVTCQHVRIVCRVANKSVTSCRLPGLRGNVSNGFWALDNTTEVHETCLMEWMLIKTWTSFMLAEKSPVSRSSLIKLHIETHTQTAASMTLYRAGMSVLDLDLGVCLRTHDSASLAMAMKAKVLVISLGIQGQGQRLTVSCVKGKSEK